MFVAIGSGKPVWILSMKRHDESWASVVHVLLLAYGLGLSFFLLFLVGCGRKISVDKAEFFYPKLNVLSRQLTVFC